MHLNFLLFFPPILSWINVSQSFCFSEIKNYLAKGEETGAFIILSPVFSLLRTACGVLDSIHHHKGWVSLFILGKKKNSWGSEAGELGSLLVWTETVLPQFQQSLGTGQGHLVHRTHKVSALIFSLFVPCTLFLGILLIFLTFKLSCPKSYSSAHSLF